MLKLVPKEKPQKRIRRDWQPLIDECVALVESGKCKSLTEAAWHVARAHAAEGVNYSTLSVYVNMWRRFRVEPSKESVAG